jgi:hypothetical protein
MPNGSSPLNFVRSIPARGSRNVSPGIRVITLFFDKNVVNDAVWTNNRNQIRMFRGSIRVPIRVTRIRDTVNFSQRRKIFVRPINRLRPNTRYTIVIGRNLKSKAGERLGRTVTVSFRTGNNGIALAE